MVGMQYVPRLKEYLVEVGFDPILDLNLEDGLFRT